MKILPKRIALLIIFCLTFTSAYGVAYKKEEPGIASEPGKIITLRTPPANAQGYYLSEVLTIIYNKLGYEVSFINTPGVRELQLAAASNLSGVLARDRVVESSFPDLVRVDISLFEYQVILVGDRRECGFCLPENITSVGYPRGLVVFDSIIERFFNKPNVIALTNTHDVEEVVLKKRLPAFLTVNIDYSANLDSSPHIVKHVLDVRPDYHYLSPQNAFLKPLIERELRRLKESGELKKLKAQFGIHDFQEQVAKQPKDLTVKAVSGHWEAYTETDGTGVYWGLLEEGLPKSIMLQKEASSWLRATRQFKSNKADILVGTYMGMPKGYLTSKYHIDYEASVVALTQDLETLNRLKNNDLELNICAAETYELVKKQLSDKALIYRADFFLCEQLFLQKRVDVIVEYPYNVSSFFDQYPSMEFYESLPLFIMFQNNDKGRWLKMEFDKGIEEASRKNKLSKHFISLEDYKHARIKPL